jgi:hypothetical protein
VKYQNKSFSVGSSKKYREAWEVVFGKQQRPRRCPEKSPLFGQCRLGQGHRGPHRTTPEGTQWINGEAV